VSNGSCTLPPSNLRWSTPSNYCPFLKVHAGTVGNEEGLLTGPELYIQVYGKICNFTGNRDHINKK